VSVEDQQTADQRIPLLLQTPAAVRFISAEPLLGAVSLAPWIRQLDWVIVGGESGPRFRLFDLDWARTIRDQCTSAGVPFHFKQVGGRTPKAGGKALDGREWCQFPLA
jgi:protein gp37